MHHRIYVSLDPRLIFFESRVDSEIRTRTFWALYCLGVETSATFGVPPLLRLADCGQSVAQLRFQKTYRFSSFQTFPNLCPSMMPLSRRVKVSSRGLQKVRA